MSDARRIQRARASFDGLSVGDAFGERFFGPGAAVMPRIEARSLPPSPWRWTDDTAMAASLLDVLEECGGVDPDRLARAFVKRWQADPARGYGAGAHELLDELAAGADWRVASRSLFRGVGSFGNGAAMRVAPLGAYFADDLARLKIEATRSASVTHAHEEGVAGAIAVAVAAALGWRDRETVEPRGPDLLREVAAHVPAGYTRQGIHDASSLAADTTLFEAAVALGNGSGVTAPDTVPFCLWVVSRELHFEEAMWRTVSVLGDRDTTCAIVGGILGARGEHAGVPPDWLAAREPIGP